MEFSKFVLLTKIKLNELASANARNLNQTDKLLELCLEKLRFQFEKLL